MRNPNQRSHYHYIWFEQTDSCLDSDSIFATEEEFHAHLKEIAESYFDENSEYTQLKVLVGCFEEDYSGIFIYDKKPVKYEIQITAV